MAFVNKIGSLLKRAVASNTANPSMLQTIRSMSSSKLFGGVSYNADDMSPKEAFNCHGEVIEGTARNIMDREMGRSRSFGSVAFNSAEKASAALAAMDGKGQTRAGTLDMVQGQTRAGTDRFGLGLGLRGDQPSQKKSRDLVHILLKSRKKTFVTVTDAKGNKKTGASAGSLEGGRKGRSRPSRYAAEATAEHVGRSARKMGLKSVVVKVKGYSFFRKKKKVIMSWREGFLGEGVGDQSPITHIHDMTQLPHNGCRLPKKRRV